MGNSQDQNTAQDSASLDKAKKDYAVLLQKITEMSQQYGQVTGQMKQVVKDQGVPVWDDKESKIKISHDVNFADNGIFHETDREIKVVMEKPGLRKGSIRVTIENDKTLHLRAFKKSIETGKSDEMIDEKIDLPSMVSDPGPKARYEDGILTVVIKKSFSQQKTVDVPVQ